MSLTKTLSSGKEKRQKRERREQGGHSKLHKYANGRKYGKGLNFKPSNTLSNTPSHHHSPSYRDTGDFMFETGLFETRLFVPS